MFCPIIANKQPVKEKRGQTNNCFSDHLGKMTELAKSPKADLSRDFTVPQVAEKHGWTEPMVWSEDLENKGK